MDIDDQISRLKVESLATQACITAILSGLPLLDQSGDCVRKILTTLEELTGGGVAILGPPIANSPASHFTKTVERLASPLTDQRGKPRHGV